MTDHIPSANGLEALGEDLVDASEGQADLGRDRAERLVLTLGLPDRVAQGLPSLLEIGLGLGVPLGGLAEFCHRSAPLVALAALDPVLGGVGVGDHPGLDRVAAGGLEAHPHRDRDPGPLALGVCHVLHDLNVYPPTQPVKPPTQDFPRIFGGFR